MDAGPVFALIFAVIAVGFFLAFGYESIAGLFDYGGKAALMNALEDIEKDAKAVYTYSKGSSRTYQANIPADARICFINPSDPGSRIWPGKAWKNWEPPASIKRMVTSEGSEFYGSNIWYFQPDSPIGRGEKLLDGRLVPKPQYSGDTGNFCIVAGKTIFLENMGTRVEAGTA